MPTQNKVDTVEELREKFTRCTITVATDYTGLPVNTVTELRQRMRERDIEYRVVKNTLTYLAADSANTPQIRDIVVGPTALAFGYKDPVDVAKALDEYIRANRSTLAIKGAVLDGRVLTPDEVVRLSTLPPRSELVAQLLGRVQLPIAALMGQLQAPIGGLINVLNGPLASLSILLQQRAEQLKSQQ
jgi:large subunit ribosomal protein L10